jgi:L-alanine-DL-glutamate epimerase-like enolase superfamily enzyme
MMRNAAAPACSSLDFQHDQRVRPLNNPSRRTFLKRAATAVLAAGSGVIGSSCASFRSRRRELRINRIVVQEARGRRLTPVAPNAYAAYRGYDVREPILRIQTAQGLEGIAHNTAKPERLKALLGLDPFALFEWEGDIIRGVAESHRQLFENLGGADVALFDLLGRALHRPVADLLGKRVRKEVTVYDSCLYMEDLLKPSERTGLVYLNGPEPSDPVELVARKAVWVLNRPEGVRVLKIKTGRAKWMSSFEEALQRDIAVFKAVRKAVGKDIVLAVDGNDGYRQRPLAAAEFAEAVADLDVYLMEEMFPEDKLTETFEVKRRLHAAGMKTKLADGESLVGGIREQHRSQRFKTAGHDEPLFDIDQADMNANGYLRLRKDALDCVRRGMTLAPHNFGSKFGFYAMVHLGLVTPNWEFCEADDTQIPALVPSGFQIRNGVARVTGEPGLGLTLREDALEKPATVLES